MTWPESVDEALCVGWIDGVRRRIDDDSYVIRFTPRKTSSTWSVVNSARVADLAAQGRMRPAGLAEVESARADGRWDRAYVGSATAEVPADLQRTLDGDPAAAAAFAALDRANRYAVLYRIGAVKRAETRTRKISEFVSRLGQGWRPYP